MADKNRNYISAGVCAAMLVMLAILHIYVRMAADDFYYATFCSGGIRAFLSDTVYHYQNVTGRALVHFLLCPLLLLDMIPFRVWNVLLIGFVTFLAAKLAAGGRKNLWQLWALSLVLFPFIGAATLGDGALWGAGSFNYLFPTTLVVLYFLLLRKYAPAERGGWLVPGAAFLCAATVEMTGILVPVTVLYVYFSERRVLKKRKAFMLVNLVAACAGYATLFGTGGVASRLSENGYASITLLRRAALNYELFSRMICDGSGIFIIVSAALLCAGVYFIVRRKYIPAACGFALALLPVLTGTGVIWTSIGIATVGGLCALSIFAFGAYVFTRGERVIPFFALTTFLSLGVCLASPIVGMRMILPTAVFLTAFALRTLAISVYDKRALTIAGAVILIPAALITFRFVTKYAENAAVIDSNVAAAESYDGGGALYLQNVPDERYGHGTVPSTGNFGEYFCKLKGIAAVIENYDADSAVLTCGGTALETPAILRDGEWYVTVRSVGALLGAETSWDYSYAVIDTGERRYRFHMNSRAVLTGGIFRDCEKLSCPVRMVCEKTYIAVKDANSLFGLNIELPLTK